MLGLGPDDDPRITAYLRSQTKRHLAIATSDVEILAVRHGGGGCAARPPFDMIGSVTKHDLWKLAGGAKAGFWPSRRRRQ